MNALRGTAKPGGGPLAAAGLSSPVRSGGASDLDTSRVSSLRSPVGSVSPPGSPKAVRSGGLADPAASRVSLLCTVLGIVVATFCAGGAFESAFGLARLLPVLLVASPVPVVLSLALRIGGRRPSLLSVESASAVLWLAVVLATVLHANPRLQALRYGVIDSWHTLLTTIPPAGRDPRLVVGVHLVVWLAASVAAETALRSRRVLVAALPAVPVLIGGMLLSAGSVPSWSVGGLVAGVGLIAIGAQAVGERGPASGVGLAALVTAVAVTVGPVLPFPATRTPYDPRRHVTPASAPQPLIDPLDQISEWLAAPQTPLFRVGSTTSADWRLAVLDGFDGQTWQQSDHFISTGTRVPASSDPEARSAPGNPVVPLDQRVTIQGLTGSWLPAADRPVEVSGVAAAIDPASGVLLAGAPLAPGLTYDVRSTAPALNAADLRTAAPATDAAAEADRRLPPGLPAVIADTAQRATAGAASPVQQAVRLADFLRTTETFDPTAPPGHAYGHLAHFLADTHRGTPEQFATAYAVMARSLGLPTRVVVGFGPGTPTADGTRQVRAGDVLAWPEVDFQGLGWVPFYPTPAKSDAPAGATAVPEGEAAPRTAVDQQLAAAPPVPVALPEPTGYRPGSATAHGISTPELLLITAAALMTAYAVALWVLPWRRRTRRRTTGSPRDRILGAWIQAMEDLQPARVTPGPADTAPQFATLAAARLGFATPGPLAELARAADLAAFSPGSAALDEGTAAHAWRLRAAVMDATRRTVPRVRRWTARLHPRVLRSR